jgi:hypothetical protein
MANSKERSKIRLVVGLRPEDFVLSEPRVNKPLCYKNIEKNKETGSMLVQDLDEVILNGIRLTYFTPNNIAVLLSTSSNSLTKARNIYIEYFEHAKKEIEIQNVDTDKKDFLNKLSGYVCDYIENIQTSIVFAYTAIETFVNLSIPKDYIYEKNVEQKGIKEIYDKEAIERWLTLKEKLIYVLPNAYECHKPDNDKCWGYFVKLEAYRHDIIHQKSIKSTEFYKTYFQRDIFDICQSAENLIKYFYNQHAEKNQTNSIWPWLINNKNYIPINNDFRSEDVEVIGNLYEGYDRKTRQ